MAYKSTDISVEDELEFESWPEEQKTLAQLYFFNHPELLVESDGLHDHVFQRGYNSGYAKGYDAGFARGKRDKTS